MNSDPKTTAAAIWAVVLIFVPCAKRSEGLGKRHAKAMNTRRKQRKQMKEKITKLKSGGGSTV